MLTVIEPATNRNLTTLLAVKAELDLQHEKDDVYLLEMIGQASAAIEAWCMRALVAETVREVIHLVEPSATLLLERCPVISIASVTIEGGALPADQYEADAGAGIVYRLSSGGSRTRWSAGRVVIDYAAGFAVPAGIPPDLNRAAVLAVRGAYLNRARDTAIKSEEIPGIITASYWSPSSLPLEVIQLIERYRAPGIA
ncbi:head-tail connector protein [Ancylobacter terrae]|uniref:head-tail connector protein n=1 Tax=Ancylobacter sp. sgz301288 TaxID=3342077 RepID=UPI00385AB72F